MVGVIARKECLEIVRDGRFRIGAAIVAVLLLAALATGWRDHREAGAQHARAQAATRDHWLNQPAKDPHSAAHYGIYAFKPRLPLSLVDSGIDPYTGVASWLEAHKQNEFQFKPAQDRSAVVRFGELTAAASLQWLMPILIVLLAAEAFAGEREQGTLRQLLSAGVRPRTLALGKLAGVAMAVALVAVPAAMAGAVALAWTSAGGSELWGQRAAILTGIYLAWFVLVANVALAVSAIARSVRQALAVLFVCWAVNVLVAPRVASEVARRSYPTPTAFAFGRDVQRATYQGHDVHSFLVQRARELKARLLTTYQVARIEDLPVNVRGVDYLEREAQADATYDDAYARIWAAFDGQIAVQQRAAVVAPLVAVRSLSMAVAATDVLHHRRFAQAAEGYRRRLVRAMNENLAFRSTAAGIGYQAGPELWASLPPFQYEVPPVGVALAAQRSSAVVLAGWLLASALALGVAVSRMRLS
jgi:ABC-2 type transport system permease protein